MIIILFGSKKAKVNTRNIQKQTCNKSQQVMDMYAEHGYIFILFVYKVNRLYIIYIKLAFRDYFFIMRQKKFF